MVLQNMLNCSLELFTLIDCTGTVEDKLNLAYDWAENHKTNPTFN